MDYCQRKCENLTREETLYLAHQKLNKVVMDLQTKVTTLERNVTEIKDDNKLLRKLLETQYIKCEDATQMDTRSTTATDIRVNITTRMFDNNSSSDYDPDDTDVSDEVDDTCYQPSTRRRYGGWKLKLRSSPSHSQKYRE